MSATKPDKSISFVAFSRWILKPPIGTEGDANSFFKRTNSSVFWAFSSSVKTNIFLTV
jgi:hypothetical protein